MYNLIEFSSSYYDTAGNLQFYSKDGGTNFDADRANNNAFESFEFKVKLLENIFADGNNSILKNATIAVSLKYLSNFCRSLEMPLIHCKVELKLKQGHCVLATGGVDNTNDEYILDDKYIKNHYRLRVVDLSRQKELDADPKALQQMEFIKQLKKIR